METDTKWTMANHFRAHLHEKWPMSARVSTLVGAFVGDWHREMQPLWALSCTHAWTPFAGASMGQTSLSPALLFPDQNQKAARQNVGGLLNPRTKHLQQGANVSKESNEAHSHYLKPLAPAQPHLAPMREPSCSLGPKVPLLGRTPTGVMR